ncbi:glycolate oxidase subunit GlcF [Glaciimonas sp. CA11.2]|uniref:glycolate oxidase subunit GlcF n=1 Tax=unclassified Glaciimonas TaxID=2644401 RepID=UPI002AB57157|nr:MULTISPECIES: glycolate oxidase subunit GlcF [unclassified Glaciimonas]MDY7545425.1 glycolate oxidase subunit GlcF [Glaciimonas sp. CA11.2]MEB0013352.1 glycolate oxidase subunit GlcF [Glaciimonas sp. Cout2]MEB0082737.1 glycolate oxidase subunit GlcF [Glaciimonas sp. Gout2]MEB0164336.1 glycolate oxidase subunit GlcF [Glaciimonas sp. CA11.2]
MQTNLAPFIKDTREGQEAEAILRACVHCGFCTATCPTYQILGDELDGPRGRIYLIKQVLEGQPATAKTQLHLDRCLTCRNCESTCPSGVEYGRLLDIGRKVVDDQVPRSLEQRITRTALKQLLPRKWLFTPAFKTGQALRSWMPQKLKEKLPAKQAAGSWPQRQHARKMLLLDGCVQPAMAPNINSATARVLDALEVQVLIAPKAGCCGAIRYHLNDHEGGLDDMRRNIDAWWPYVDGSNGQKIEAIVMTASGCGTTVKEYGHLLAADAEYAEKAQKISALTRDLSEILPELETPLLAKLKGKISKRVVFHPPCTLQHGQQIRGKVEGLLRGAGVDVQLCADSHLCCGSAGTYSVLQPELSHQLRDNKLRNLEATQPEMIVSANIGCLTHLQSGTQTPVKHWIELLDQALGQPAVH